MLPSDPSRLVVIIVSDEGKDGVICGVSIPGQGICRNTLPAHREPIVCPVCKRWT